MEKKSMQAILKMQFVTLELESWFVEKVILNIKFVKLNLTLNAKGWNCMCSVELSLTFKLEL